jgi:hypothetical protein
MNISSIAITISKVPTETLHRIFHVIFLKHFYIYKQLMEKKIAIHCFIAVFASHVNFIYK